MHAVAGFRMEKIGNWKGAGRPQKAADERYSEARSVHFQPSQIVRLESWLRKHRPGAKVASFVRDTALEAMERAERKQDSDTILIHLDEESREKIMAKANQLRQRDLGIFLEELALRVAEADPDEVERFYLGKKNDPAPMIDVRALLDEIQNKRGEEEERKSA